MISVDFLMEFLHEKKKKECQPPIIGTRFIRFRVPKNIEQITGNKWQIFAKPSNISAKITCRNSVGLRCF